MKESMKRLMAVMMVMSLVMGIVMPVMKAEAAASAKAMKFLKGTWVTVGNSRAVKVKFTKKYVKYYSCWNEDMTEVYGGKKLGKFIGKSKIVSTKKKGKNWVIKVKGQNGVYYFKGNDDFLLNTWKVGGEWHVSYSDSLERL